MTELPEEHHQGVLSIENLPFIQEMDLQNCDFGLQVAWDGRVWVCVNGVAFLRFKPQEGAYDNYLSERYDSLHEGEQIKARVEKQVATDQHILKRLK